MRFPKKKKPMADEADSGTEQQQYPIANKIKKTTDSDPADNDNDKVTASSNSNYDSNDGVSSPLLRCERCDKFETHSHSILLLHTVQCATQHVAAAAVAAAAVAAAASTTTTGIGIVTGGAEKTIPSSAAGRSSSSIHLHNNNIVTATNAKHQNNENTAAIGAAGSGSGGDIETGGSSDMHENSMGSTATNPDNTDTNKSQTQNSNRKLFECDVCNMKFSNGANMRRHKMRHTGVKPYECRVCQKRFFRKDHLAEHFTTHTKTLPYHCPICNRGFQRQIAMRAHFQNEHVGQHDLVKTCPLCSYRAGTMKSLRVHFFNRHGIDLDNPGPGAPSSLLLALDPQNTGQYLPQNLSAAMTCVPTYSDSGDSIRSTENVTPPMHFLTPHVEISMAENVDSFSTDTAGGISKNHHPSLDIKLSNGPNGISPSSPQSIDSNSNVPSSSHTTLTSSVQSPRGNQNEGHITPSISLIPIKQEPSNDDYFSDKNNISNSGDHLASSSGVGNSLDSAIPTSSLTSLIKVSPLKSLLREDLKRRICARANTRAARNLNNNLALANSYLTATNLSSSAVAISAAAAGSNGCNISGSSLSSGSNMHAEIVATNIGGGGSSCGNIIISNSATTTSATNGIITSTGGQETDLTSIGGNVGNGGNGSSSVAGGISGGRIIYNKKYLQCLFCGIEFPDQTLYFLHKGCHSESNPWKCNICGEQCNNVYEFNSHLLSKSHQ